MVVALLLVALFASSAAGAALANAGELAAPGLFARNNGASPITPSKLTPPAHTIAEVVASNISYEPDFPSPQSTTKFPYIVILSVDGMHQSDLSYYVSQNPKSNFATLVNGGIEYTNATTSTPSDSFPGTVSIITGASPRTAGVFYDVAHARDLYPPGSNCSGASGADYAFDETLDLNTTILSGGGGFNTSMFNMRKNSYGACVPIYPHDFLRVNTMFEVARFAGFHAAYCDKHPAYEIVNGPSGLGLSDSYFPEINAVSSLADTEGYDALHWSALANWTAGLYHNGSVWSAGTPAIYGANFQAVSVGQKTYGYSNNGTTPTANLTQAFDYTDGQLGTFIGKLKSAGIYEKTLLIVTAKHGQSAKDVSKRRIIDDGLLQNSTNITFAGLAADDVAYIWLDSYTQAAQVKSDLLKQASALGIAQVFADHEVLNLGLGDPRQNPRTPDIVVRTIPGVIYASPKATKLSEHGGLNPDDLQVLLVAHNPKLKPGKNSQHVTTRQIAATTIAALGLDPALLDGVRAESTQVLPGVLY